MTPTPLTKTLLLALAAFLWVAVVVKFVLSAPFALDEYGYAHAGWLIARGQIPYRDFGFFHPPLNSQFIGFVFGFLDDRPENLQVVRGLTIVWIVLSAMALVVLNRGYGIIAQVFVPLLMIVVPYLFSMAELRPDTLAFTLFIGAVAVLRMEAGGAVLRCLLSGMLLGLACWTTEKVPIYGFPFGLAVLGALFGRSGARVICPKPVVFIAGLSISIALCLHYVIRHDNYAQMADFIFNWGLRHEKYYPRVSWAAQLEPFALELFGFFALLAYGVVRLYPKRSDPEREWTLLLHGVMITSFLSYVMQRGPYRYSLIPFLGVAIVFAARGVMLLWRRTASRSAAVEKRRAGIVAMLFSVLVVIITQFLARHFVAQEDAHDRQVTRLRLIGELSDVNDVFYDNSGAAVTRPHLLWLFTTDRIVRMLIGQPLSDSAPAEMLRKGCVGFLVDRRLLEMPAEFLQYLRDHFRPYTKSLWLWGHNFKSASLSGAPETFLAVRDDEYRVWPASVLKRGELRIDGVEVSGETLHLTKGEHRVEYRAHPGEDVTDFDILWLPKSGRCYRPVVE